MSNRLNPVSGSTSGRIQKSMCLSGLYRKAEASVIRRFSRADYVFEWQASGEEPKQPVDSKPRHGPVRALKSAPAIHKLAASVYHLYRTADSQYRLSELNPHLEEVPVSSLVHRATDTEVRAPEVA